jgi:hypothetical protein
MQKTLSILAYIVFLPIMALAQHTELRGIVLTASTAAPIENVSIKIRNTNSGTSSDSEGKFKLSIKEFPVIIEVSCIGFEPLSLEITKESSDNVEIILQTAVQQLEGVTIMSKKVVPVFQDHDYSVLDYEIMDDNLLLLIYRYQLKRSVLLLIRRKGDTLAQTPLPEVPPGKLYKDMLGNVHYFSKKGNAYQCFYDQSSKTISFPYCYPVDTLMKTIGKFLFMMNNRVFFQENAPDGFSTLLGYFEKGKGKTYLQLAGDPWVARDYYSDLKYYSQPRRNDELSQSMKGFEMRAFEMFYKPKSISCMAKAGYNRIAVFNFTNDSLQIRNSDWKLISSTTFSFHKQVKENMLSTVAKAYSGDKWIWRWTIFTDDYSGRIYTTFEKQGHYKLCSIDLNTGKIIAEYELPVLFAKKITIYKGEAFFLYKPIGESEKRKLYKMRL